MRRTAVCILAIAVCARLVTSLLQISYGIHPITGLPDVNSWGDFYYYYVAQLKSLSQGLLPYRDFALSYTPLFIYTIYPFYAIWGRVGAAVPIVLSDAGTAVLLYMIVRRAAGEEVAVIVGLGYSLSPLALVEEGYLWLGSQPMTFLLLLSILLLRNEKRVLAWSMLAIAVMIKQEAIWVFPAFLLLADRKDKIRTLIGAGTFSLLILLLSMPFLILTPYNYLNSVTYSIFSHATLNQLPPGPQEGTGVFTSNVLHTVLITYSNPILIYANNFVDWVSAIAVLPLYALLLPVLFEFRSKDSFKELVSAYSVLGLLLVFYLLGHPVFRYYLLPVWVLVLASSRSRRTSVLSVVLCAASVLTPAGIFQVMLVLVTMLVIIAFLDSTKGNGIVDYTSGLTLGRSSRCSALTASLE